MDKWCPFFLKYSFYICDLLFTSFTIDMKITSAIYLVFTATLFLLLQIICLYRNCINNQTKHTLIAFSRDAIHCVSTYPQLRTYSQLRTYTYLHPGTIADHVRGDLSVNKTDFNALRAYAVFCGFILLLCQSITISTRKTKAEWWQNKPCIVTKCPLDNDATSTG